MKYNKIFIIISINVTLIIINLNCSNSNSTSNMQKNPFFAKLGIEDEQNEGVDDSNKSIKDKNNKPSLLDAFFGSKEDKNDSPTNNSTYISSLGKTIKATKKDPSKIFENDEYSIDELFRNLVLESDKLTSKQQSILLIELGKNKDKRNKTASGLKFKNYDLSLQALVLKRRKT